MEGKTLREILEEFIFVPLGQFNGPYKINFDETMTAIDKFYRAKAKREWVPKKKEIDGNKQTERKCLWRNGYNQAIEYMEREINES